MYHEILSTTWNGLLHPTAAALLPSSTPPGQLISVAAERRRRWQRHGHKDGHEIVTIGAFNPLKNLHVATYMRYTKLLSYASRCLGVILWRQPIDGSLVCSLYGRCKPPSSLVSGQKLTMCDTVWMSPKDEVQWRQWTDHKDAPPCCGYTHREWKCGILENSYSQAMYFDWCDSTHNSLQAYISLRSCTAATHGMLPAWWRYYCIELEWRHCRPVFEKNNKNVVNGPS